MSESVHLDLEVVELARSAEVRLLGAVSLLELVSEEFDLFVGAIGPLLFHRASIFGRCALSLGHVHHLHVIRAFLSCLKLKSAPLLLKVTHDAIPLVPQSFSVPFFGLLAV